MRAPTSNRMKAVLPPAITRRDLHDEISPRNAIASPAMRFTQAVIASTPADPKSGMKTNGTQNVPTIAPTVLTARRAPELVPTRSESPPTSAEAAGNPKPMMNVVGSTAASAFHTNAGGRASSEFMTNIPAIAKIAVSICESANTRGTSRILARTRLYSTLPNASPMRKTVRIVEKTYVELPVPDAIRRVQSV